MFPAKLAVEIRCFIRSRSSNQKTEFGYTVLKQLSQTHVLSFLQLSYDNNLLHINNKIKSTEKKKKLGVKYYL